MIDLNRLREVIARNQTVGTENPDNPNRQVVVDKNGNMALGDSPEATTTTTKVPQETFANVGEIP